MDRADNAVDNHQATPVHDVPSAEWASAAIGLMMLVAAIGYFVYVSMAQTKSPPKITVAVLAIEAQEAGYLVRTRVSNNGTTTAAQLSLEGTLKTKTGEEQRSEVTLDYVSAGSETSAGFFFIADPRQGELKIRPVSYQDP